MGNNNWQQQQAQAAWDAAHKQQMQGTVQQSLQSGGLNPSMSQIPWNQQNPDFFDFLNRNLYGMQGAQTGQMQSLDAAMAMPGFSVGRNLGIGGAGPTNMGLASLSELIFNRGKTDPAAMNRNISAIGRGTQQNVGEIGDEAARRGLSGSGLAMALQNAAMGAGQSRIAGARADETQLAEQRRRGDLGLLGDLVINPSLQSAGIASGVGSANADRSLAEKQQQQQQQAAMLQAMAMMAGCWVARAVYGESDSRWLAVRHWMLTKAPAALVARYIANGPSLARRVERSAHLRALLRPSFDLMVAEVG